MKSGFARLIAASILIPGFFAAARLTSYAATCPVNLSVASYWCHDHDHPIITDVDGDGLCDIVSQYGDDGSLYVTPTSKFGKPLPLIKMDLHLAGPSIARTAGHFLNPPKQYQLKHGANSPSEESLFVLRDGRVQIVYNTAPGDRQYRHADTVATLPENERLTEPAHLVMGDFDGDGMDDAALLGADGRLVLLHNACAKGDAERFDPVTVNGSIGPNVKQFVALKVKDDIHARLVWITGDGKLMRSMLQPSTHDGNNWTVKAPVAITNVNPDSKLVSGRFSGDESDDLLVGQVLFLGADPTRQYHMPNVPELKDSKLDAEWTAGDIDGHGLDDLICKRRNGIGLGQSHIHILYSSRPGDTWKGFAKSAPDGLLDSWKLGKTAPGGLDLQAMGCKVGHRDLIVEINRFEGTDDVALKAEMKRTAEYYASLPIKNRDGADGIALHCIYPPPIPKDQRDYVESHFDDLFPPKLEHGIIHSMMDDGGGVAALGGSVGHFNGGLAMFVHEMGHNLGLTHEGSSSQPFSPLYPSLMNYAYNGTLGYVIDPLGYSHGSLGSYSADATHLSEVLPFPIDTMKFLAKNPYNFHIKPSPNGQSTLVDWDWNGIYGEENVRANINYFPCTYVGDPHLVGVALTAPVVVASGPDGASRLSIIYGRTASNARGSGATLSIAHPGLLAMKCWQGSSVDQDGDQWSPEAILESDGVTGDPSACAAGEDICLAYPTQKGVCVALVKFHNNNPSMENALLIRNSARAIPTAVSVDGQLEVLLWRDEITPVGIVPISHSSNSDWSCGLEKQLNIVSAGPVAATPGARYQGQSSLIVAGLSTDNDSSSPWYRSHVYTLQNQQPVLQKAMWQSKLKSPKLLPYRMPLLWEPYPGMDPDGRFYAFESNDNNNYVDLMMNTAYPNDDDENRLSNGWVRRPIEHRSLSGPGACFFRDDIAYAYRIDSTDEKCDNLYVCFHGRGIFPGKQGDFDDILFIKEYGLELSIPVVAE